MRAGDGQRLLLHVCCGPCSIMPVRRLQEEGFEITAWYHNPNIQPLSEYLRRREAVLECAARLGIAVVCDDAAWNLTDWLRAVRDRDTPPLRCAYCCRSRVAAAWACAAARGYDAFSTSLLYSRYQPHDIIAAEGARLSGQDVPAVPGALRDLSGPRFVYRDFREDWQTGIDISREWGIYRQPYCGCVYSEAERYAKKLARLAGDAPSPSASIITKPL